MYLSAIPTPKPEADATTDITDADWTSTFVGMHAIEACATYLSAFDHARSRPLTSNEAQARIPAGLRLHYIVEFLVIHIKELYYKVKECDFWMKSRFGIVGMRPWGSHKGQP